MAIELSARGRIFTFFFFNDTATTEIYTLSLHDALPICQQSARSPRHLSSSGSPRYRTAPCPSAQKASRAGSPPQRSEEHTSELQSQSNLVCRLLLEKKKKRQFCNSCCTLRQPAHADCSH